MMMNLLMSRRKTTTSTTCYALISLLLVASLAFVVSPVNAKNGMANTNTMPESNKVTGTRMLMEESDKLMYSRIYVVVTEAADFIRLFPNGGDILIYLDDFLNKAQQANTFKSNPEFLIQGSSTTQKGMYIIISYVYISIMLCDNNQLFVCVFVCVCCLYHLSCLFSSHEHLLIIRTHSCICICFYIHPNRSCF